MSIDFNKYAQEGNAFLNQVAARLGHEGERAQATILLRAVLHTVRDRITIAESFNLLAQLPMFLKAIYVENWRYLEKPLDIDTVEAFENHVEAEQRRFGESRFDWDASTFELSKRALGALGRYLSEGEIQDITDQLPDALKDLMEEAVRI